MRTITLRRIPQALARIIEKRARAKGLSLAKAVIDLCEEGAGIRKPAHPLRHHDLDALAGTWTEEEAAAFEATLREQRKIDPELWQ
jgi:hypothetical protein